MTVPSTWRDQLDGRQQKELAFAERYALDPFGATGHNAYLLINHLSELLDIVAGTKEPPPPPGPDDYRLTFGRHRGKTLVEVLRLDRSYIEWLAKEAEKLDVRDMARALLIPPGQLALPEASTPADEGDPLL